MDLVGPFAYVLESKITVLTMVSGGNVSTSSENTRNLKLQNSQLLGNGLVISIMRPTLLLEISSISVSDLFDLSFVILRSLLPHLFGLCFAISLPSNRALNFSSLQQLTCFSVHRQNKPTLPPSLSSPPAISALSSQLDSQ
ncbi:hypothetical protein ACFX15_037900 [Malus domestica]